MAASAKLLEIALEVEPEDRFVKNRFNDGKADPTGRLYSGTMKYAANLFEATDGTVYRYASGEDVRPVIGNVGISNGFAWNGVKQKMYYIDTALLNVREYDWDPVTGDVSKFLFYYFKFTI